MRALTSEEHRLLEDVVSDVTDNRPATPAEEMFYQSMAKRGLTTLHEEDGWISIDLTVRGALALRVHRAYLASLGASGVS